MSTTSPTASSMGKGSDAGIQSTFGDWGSADGSAAADIPASTTSIVAYQPDSDEEVAWTPSPSSSHYQNLDDRNDDCPNDGTSTPTGVGQNEMFTYKGEASGVVQGVALVWEQVWGVDDPAVVHTPKARIDPDATWRSVDTPG